MEGEGEARIEEAVRDVAPGFWAGAAVDTDDLGEASVKALRLSRRYAAGGDVAGGDLVEGAVSHLDDERHVD